MALPLTCQLFRPTHSHTYCITETLAFVKLLGKNSRENASGSGPVAWGSVQTSRVFFYYQTFRGGRAVMSSPLVVAPTALLAEDPQWLAAPIERASDIDRKSARVLSISTQSGKKKGPVGL